MTPFPPHHLPRGLCATMLTATMAMTLGCSSSDKIPQEAVCRMEVEHGEASCPALCGISNDFCGDSGVSPVCEELSPSEMVDVCGVPLKEPPGSDNGYDELTRSDQVEEYAGSGPPDVSCFMPEGYPDPPGTSELVTLRGIAKLFSHGCVSHDVDISVYTVKRGGADDGMPDQLIGSDTTESEADCLQNGQAYKEDDDCEPDHMRHGCAFQIADVPTETELMVITKGDAWAPLNEYNLFIRNTDVVAGEYEKNVRALAKDDYNLVAQTAMGKTITPGNGALAGEVHDCGDVRLINAVVDVNVPKYITTYYTDNEANPLPDTGAKATSTLALYSAIDVAPGPAAVGAAGIIDGKLVGIGFFRARVFGDEVTSVTFRGLAPFQVP